MVAAAVVSTGNWSGVGATPSGESASRAEPTARTVRPRPGAGTFAHAEPSPVPETEVEDPDDPDQPDTWADPAIKPLTVLVVDLEDRPLGGVPVIVLGAATDGGTVAGPKLTRRDGRARFPVDLALEREGDLIVAARAMPGAAAFAPVSVTLGHASDVRLKVDPGLVAAVRVLDPEGLPFQGTARVRKIVMEDPPPEAGPRGPQLTAALSETTPRAVREGDRYLLPGLRVREEFLLFAAAPGFASTVSSVEAPEHPPKPWSLETRLGGRCGAVVFRALPPAGFEGWAFGARFVDDVEMLAVAGADDRPTQTSPAFRRDTPIGQARRLRVDAYATGVAVASAEVDVPALRAGETLDLGSIKLDPVRVVLAGLVVDSDDRPVEGATVEALPYGAAAPLATVTDAAGTFSLKGLLGRGPYHVAAHAPGRATGRLDVVAEGSVDLRLMLEAAGAIEGRVFAPEGVLRAHLRVRALRADRAPLATTPSADGAFKLTGLPAGVHVVIVDGPGIEPLRVGDVVVTPPETTKDDRLMRLEPRAPSGGLP